MCVCPLPEAIADAHGHRRAVHVLNEAPVVTMVLERHDEWEHRTDKPVVVSYTHQQGVDIIKTEMTQVINLVSVQ